MNIRTHCFSCIWGPIVFSCISILNRRLLYCIPPNKHTSLCVSFTNMNLVHARLSAKPQMRLSLLEQCCAGEVFISVSKILFGGMSQQNEFLPLSLHIAVEPRVSRVAQPCRLFTAFLLTLSPLTV